MTLLSSAIAMAAGSLHFGVNSPLLRCCRYRFRSYSGSLLADARMAGPAKSKQKVLPLPSGPTSSGPLVPSLFQGPDRMRPTDEGPSLAHRGSRGIHAAQPLTQRFHSAF